jgi:predicted ATPase/class 3 adenylate cyclase
MERTTKLPEGTVTFLTTDVVSFSSLFELDPEGTRELARLQLSLICSVIDRHGGHSFKTVGDAVWCAFQSAPAAVRCAIEIGSVIESEPQLQRLRLRIGIVTGEAKPVDNDYLEQSLNRLSRICGACRPGKILVGETTFELVKGEFEFVCLGMVSLKGVPSQHLYELSGVVDPAPSSRRVRHLRKLHNLPSEERPFIGRERERSTLVRLIREGKRLITVTGMGGIGKTRLCRQVAADLASEKPEGCWIVDCDGIESESELLAAVASVLHLHLSNSSVSELANLIDGREMLLVLDCFERIAEHCARCVDELLRDTEGVQLLISSRVVLGLGREYSFGVGALAVKGKSRTDSEAVQLFMEAATHSLDVNLSGSKTLSACAEIVTRLEGVPLAILLAASRLRYLTAEELLAQINVGRLNLDRGHGGQASDRHQNLYRVVKDSFMLLGPNERNLLVALTAFHGFYMEDAVAVLHGESNVRNSIFLLKDHSLLVSSSRGGRTRYRILDTIREFVQESEELVIPESVRESHASHFTNRARVLREGFTSTDWKGSQAEFWLELANFREAIRCASANCNVELLREQARVLARPLAEANLLAEFEILANADPGEDYKLQIELLGLEGALSHRRGEWKDALLHWGRRADICKLYSEDELFADTLIDMSETALMNGDLATARDCVERYESFPSAASFEGILAANGHVMRANLFAKLGQKEQAISHLDRARSSLVEQTDSRDHIYVWGVSAKLLAEFGRWEEAQKYAQRALLISAASQYSGEAASLLIAMVERARIAGQVDALVEFLSLLRTIPLSAGTSIASRARSQLDTGLDPCLRGRLEELQDRYRDLSWTEAICDWCKVPIGS